MIRVNLTQRIWLSFIFLIGVIGLLLSVLYPISIKGTLTEETYVIIEQEQARYTNPFNDYSNPPTSEFDFIERREAERSVGHLFFLNQFGTLKGDPVPNEVVQEMGKNAFAQKQGRGRYELTYYGATLFYVVNKLNAGEEEIFQISYMWDTYRDRMVNKLWERLFYILLVTGAISLIPVFLLKRYLRQPLTMLGNHFEQIAKRNLQEPFKWQGDEDFQKLSDQFEQMRQNLIRYDRAQKTFIQHASHELKTPIMIIKSYAQASKDGVLPIEKMDKTMDVILEETGRMEKRVKDMIYFTKLDSIKEQIVHQENIVFGEFAGQLTERFMMQREDVSFFIEGENIQFKGDIELLQVLLENFVENALRYAKDSIWIKARIQDKELCISVENNGGHIDEEVIPHLFEPFHKGNKGQFGLGLAIVKRISQLLHGRVSAENIEDGVCFSVVFPLEAYKID